jgi:hypothetical protein
MRTLRAQILIATQLGPHSTSLSFILTWTNTQAQKLLSRGTRKRSDSLGAVGCLSSQNVHGFPTISTCRCHLINLVAETEPSADDHLLQQTDCHAQLALPL